MFIIDENTGDLTLHQGDTGEYIITDLSETLNGESIYFEVRDNKRRTIGTPISSIIEDQIAVFRFNKSLTDLFIVKLSEETAEYQGGIKICTKTGDEETVKVGNKADGENIIITVYPKIVEGE